MDETTWWTTTTDRTWMLEHIRSTAGDRKARLFGCACVRRVGHLLPEVAWQAVEMIERLIDEGGSQQVLQGVPTELIDTLYAAPDSPARRAAGCIVEPTPLTALHAATHALAAVPRITWRAELAAQCDLVRCQFGNPFRPSRLNLPGWGDDRGAVQNLARVIRDENRFGDLPILADALEDAGCTDEPLLSHCRHLGPHGRGCWALDLILAAPGTISQGT
jgi:hypothetical protein